MGKQQSKVDTANTNVVNEIEVDSESICLSKVENYLIIIVVILLLLLW